MSCLTLRKDLRDKLFFLGIRPDYTDLVERNHLDGRVVNSRTSCARGQ